MGSTNTLLTVIGLAILAFIILGMLISQSNHRARKARNEQINQLQLQQRRLNNLLRSLPASYLSVELRDFIYQALQQNLKSQITLARSSKEHLISDLEQVSAERLRVRDNPPAAETLKLTADQASLYRGLLKSLYQFIRRNYETGRLNKDHAEKIINQVELKLIETAVDYFTLIGGEFHAEQKYRQARNAYQKALDAIEGSIYSSRFKQQTVKLRNELNKLVDEWRENRDVVSKAASEKLAGGFESFVEEQDSWKKKQDYE
ncbi:hypothetical protein [Reinekea marinisedimentorum]|uniref:Uncharacterized protein n=1 Tax=Reinekea marinisedimentorum TaxID=230495 RepID=A0A4R3I9F4_9GAMM|nr:hypothetical protein [Reinekea marinisedimentorum]TCS41993.1 hypothetical protein BCF53_10497 [Reinekea marinisedimentorum]